MVQQGLEHFVYQDFRKTAGISSIWEWIKKESEWLTSAKLGYKLDKLCCTCILRVWIAFTGHIKGDLK